jgi:hypothetical protein
MRVRVTHCCVTVSGGGWVHVCACMMGPIVTVTISVSGWAMYVYMYVHVLSASLSRWRPVSGSASSQWPGFPNLKIAKYKFLEPCSEWLPVCLFENCFIKCGLLSKCLFSKCVSKYTSKYATFPWSLFEMTLTGSNCLKIYHSTWRGLRSLPAQDQPRNLHRGWTGACCW